MALSVVTRGYSVGSAAFVVTRGYGDLGAAPEPHGFIRRRGRRPIWQEETPEEVALEEVQIEYQSLVSDQTLLRQELKTLGKLSSLREQRARVTVELTLLNRKIKATKAELQKKAAVAERIRKRRQDMEMEDVAAIMMFIEELYG